MTPHFRRDKESLRYAELDKIDAASIAAVLSTAFGKPFTVDSQKRVNAFASSYDHVSLSAEGMSFECWIDVEKNEDARAIAVLAAPDLELAA